MTYFKKIAVSTATTFISILILTIIVAILSFFNILKGNITTILKIFIPIVSFFIGGLMIGKNSNQKGWLEGIKEGLIVVVLMIIFSFLAFQNGFEIKNIIYYIILITSSTLGSMIGINFKKKGDSK